MPRQSRRLITFTVLGVLLLGAISMAMALAESSGSDSVEATGGSEREPGADDEGDDPSETSAADNAGPTTTVTTTTMGPPAIGLTLNHTKTIGGPISPKSVVASPTGVVTAQNMMYRHTMTAYDSEGELLTTLNDTVTPSEFGFDIEGSLRGAPVEAAFVSDGSRVYVSNYSMYGPGYREGSDTCSPESGYKDSFVYGVNTDTWQVEQMVLAGAVPKFLAVTPDDKHLLVTNWCSYDLVVAEVESGEVVQRIPMGRYPRGVAITPDGATAYVAVMGGGSIKKVDLEDFSVETISGVGEGPRHLTMDPEGRFLYVTLNGDGVVAKFDLETEAAVASVSTGDLPRSMAISDDGTALYVVNYGSDTMTKLDADTMTELQTVPTGDKPIGITYEPTRRRVWVANYSGSIYLFDEE